MVDKVKRKRKRKSTKTTQSQSQKVIVNIGSGYTRKRTANPRTGGGRSSQPQVIYQPAPIPLQPNYSTEINDLRREVKANREQPQSQRTAPLLTARENLMIEEGNQATSVQSQRQDSPGDYTIGSSGDPSLRPLPTLRPLQPVIDLPPLSEASPRLSPRPAPSRRLTRSSSDSSASSMSNSLDPQNQPARPRTFDTGFKINGKKVTVPEDGGVMWSQARSDLFPLGSKEVTIPPGGERFKVNKQYYRTHKGESTEDGVARVMASPEQQAVFAKAAKKQMSKGAAAGGSSNDETSTESAVPSFV